ncbi:MAG: RIO1 family regulatory kinase/ATPase, partial [Chloroflexota bacterium]
PKQYDLSDFDYEDIEADFLGKRPTRRRRDPNYKPKKSESEIINELADEVGVADGFEMTYSPGEKDDHENQWLQDSLISFFYQDLITDIMAVVKGGKEASVYRARAHESTGKTWLAAKVYRPRFFRSLRNDKMYRQGRAALNRDGKEINAKDWRALKAMSKGGNQGQTMSHTSWLMYENKTLHDLYNAGASVPQPIEVSENALLMEYIGDENGSAPTLSEVTIMPEEVEPLFRDVMRNIDIMLQHNIIHGDLSAYNILYWEGKIVLIDFPQVVDIHNNPHARKILTRDILRVCENFQNLGLDVNAQEIADSLWYANGKADANQEELLVNELEDVSFEDYEEPETLE